MINGQELATYLILLATAVYVIVRLVQIIKPSKNTGCFGGSCSCPATKKRIAK